MPSPSIHDKFIRPLVIGHRGYKALYPENTLAAFAAAVDAGADMIEFDVQLSKDGVPVVIHDRDLDRTTSGTGPVTSRLFAELKNLDAGSWFHPRFGGEAIPTLDGVLDLIGNKIPINIEIKVDTDQRPREYEGIDRKVIDAVHQRGLLPSVVISSFHKEILQSLHRAEPAAAIGVLTEFGESIDLAGVCRDLDAFSWNPHYLDLTPGKVAFIHGIGAKIIPYTVNAPADIRRVLDQGVDGLFTDDPALALKIRSADQ